MSERDDLQPALRQKSAQALQRLSPAAREALLIKCWMSHDARWFMAVVKEFGLAVANRLNQIAAHDIGKVEAQRLARALELPPMATLDDYLLAQEMFISLLGPDLIEYRVFKVGDDAYQMRVRRCFAYDNAVRAGIDARYECGILARVTGWFDALGLVYEIDPPLGKCLKAQGRECVYTIETKLRQFLEQSVNKE